MTHFKELRTHAVVSPVLSSTVADAEPELELTSPALKVINNFTLFDPLRANLDTSIATALSATNNQCSDYILVVDDHNSLQGIATRADLQSAKVLSIAQRLGVKRDEVTLKHLMIPTRSLASVSMQSLSYACIGDALQTMEHQGIMFLLVTTPENEICGLVSAREIAKKLHIPVNISPIAQSFSEVMENIEHPH